MTDRRQTALTTFARHTIAERHIIDEKRASFRLAPPPETYCQYYEIQAARWGNLICYGDWEPVVFGGGAWHHWRGAIHWIGYCSDAGYYPAQKARIGSGRSWQEWDEDEARLELRQLRRDGVLTREQAREVWSAIEDESQHTAQELLADALGDWEIAGGFGMVLAYPVWMAWAACRRLDELLDAEEAQQPA